MIVRPYRPGDEAAVIDVWNAALPSDPINAATVWERYLHAMRACSLFRGEVSSFPYEQWYRGASEMRGAEAGYPHAVALMKPESIYSRRRPVQSLLE